MKPHRDLHALSLPRPRGTDHLRPVLAANPGGGARGVRAALYLIRGFPSILVCWEVGLGGMGGWLYLRHH